MLMPAAAAGAAQVPAAGGSGPAATAVPSTGTPAASVPTITSAFPDPPHALVHLFTDENVADGLCPDPPDPLTGGAYSMFGVTMTCEDQIIRSLEEQGISRLYHRNFDRRKELKKMNQSLLLSFMDLLDVLVLSPDTGRRVEMCQHISLLFIQMHHLINELRPHQSRESIRVSHLLQRKSRIATADRVNQHIQSVTQGITVKVQDIPAELLLPEPPEPDSAQLQPLCAPGDEPLLGYETTDELVQLDLIMCHLVLSDI